MSDEKKDPMANPFSGAATCLAAAACVAVGAELRGHSVHDEAIAYLAGGSITGAIAGTVGMFTIPNTDNSSSLTLKLCSWTLKTGLAVAATVTGPIMAELLVDNSSSAMETVEDAYIGAGMITGSALGLAATVGAVYGASYCWNNASLPSFFSRSTAGSGTTEAINTSAIDLEVQAVVQSKL